MAKNLKEAMVKHRDAADDLDRALCECLAAMRERDDAVVEGRFRVVGGDWRRRRAKM